MLRYRKTTEKAIDTLKLGTVGSWAKLQNEVCLRCRPVGGWGAGAPSKKFGAVPEVSCIYSSVSIGYVFYVPGILLKLC